MVRDGDAGGRGGRGHRVRRAAGGRRGAAAGGRFDRLFPLLFGLAWAALHLAISLAFFPVGDIGVETDFYGELAEGARQLWQGHFSVLNHPYKGPLTSLLVAGLYAVVHPLGGDWYRAGVLLNALAAGAALALTYRLLLLACGRRVAVLGTLSTGLVYEMFTESHKASSDVLFLLLFTLTAWLVVRTLWPAAAPSPGSGDGRDGGGRWLGGLGAAGAAAGLALLTRYNGIVLPVAGVLAILLAAPRGVPARRRLLGGAVLLGAFAVVVAPWFLLGLAETGRPLATRNLQNIFVEELGTGAAGPAAEAPPAGYQPATLLEVVRQDPGRAALRWARNLGGHLWRDLTVTLHPVAVPLFGLGLLALALARPDRRQTAFLLFPLCYFLAMAAVYHQPRFSLPLLAGYWAIAWSWVVGPLGPWARPRRTGLIAARILAVLIVGVVLAFEVRDVIRTERLYHERRPLEVLPAARFLAARADSLAAARPAAGAGAGAVMARKPHLAFYAGLPFAPYPARLESRASLFEAARERGARWLAYGDIERLHYPWEGWLAELGAVPGVEVVYDTPELRIYELDPARLAAGPRDEEAEHLAERLAAAERGGSAAAGDSGGPGPGGAAGDTVGPAPAAGDPLAIAAAAAAVGRRWADLGEWDPAATALTRALRAAERAADAGAVPTPAENEGVGGLHPCGLRVELAWALAHLSRWEKIRAQLEPLAGGRPGAAPVDRDCPRALAAATHDLLGRAYLNLGLRDEAVAQLETALAGYEATGNPAPAATVRRALAALR